MPEDSPLSALTRSLMLGVSLGAVALVSAGCVPAEIPVGSAAEQEACSRALSTRSAADASAVLSRFPSSPCIAPLLAALPPETLAGLSPAAVAGLSPEVVQALPPGVRAQVAQSAAAAADAEAPPRGARPDLRSQNGDDDRY